MRNIVKRTRKVLGLRPGPFICFSVSGTPDETLALVFDILLENHNRMKTSGLLTVLQGKSFLSQCWLWSSICWLIVLIAVLVVISFGISTKVTRSAIIALSLYFFFTIRRSKLYKTGTHPVDGGYPNFCFLLGWIRSISAKNSTILHCTRVTVDRPSN